MSIKPKPWSPSSLSTFKSCPRKFHAETILKMKDPPGEAQLWGTMVHDTFEKYIKGEMDLPRDFLQHKPFLDSMMSEGTLIGTEVKYGISTDLKPCEFFDDNLWHRGVIDWWIDLGNRSCRIVDHKTGKEHSKMDQLQCYAIYALLSGFDEVEVMYYWTASKAARPRTRYTKDQLYTLIRKFLPDLAQLAEAYKEDIWQPRQNGLCRKWCQVTGCEWNGRGRSR